MARFLFAVCLLMLTQCALLKSVDSPSADYRSYLEEKVTFKQLFDRGRALISVKALLAGNELKARQAAYTPGFTFERDELSQQVIVALDMPTWERFSTDDLGFLLNGVAMNKIREIVNPVEVESHYPFAHPHYRVFLLNFPGESQGQNAELELRTLRGPLLMSLKKQEESSS